MKRLIAIGFIWAACAAAWVVLGTTIQFRTGESSSELMNEVHALWGPPLSLTAPAASWSRPKKVQETVTQYAPNGAPFSSTVERQVSEQVAVPLAGTEADVSLALEHRRKGLLWFPTYALDFRGRYSYLWTGDAPEQLHLFFAIPQDNVGLDGFEVLGEDGKPIAYEITRAGAQWDVTFKPGERRSFQVAFRTRGTSTFRYELNGGGSGQVRDFKLALHADFEEVDFPAGSMSPTRQTRQGGAWSGEWDFKSLISGANIGLDLPQRLNPGVVASRITFFAPVGLLFFFFVVTILALAERKNLHPLNYFFLASAFFAFHLLFAYLVDHVPLAPSFALASFTSTALVVTYARWFVGWKFSLREMGMAQLLYLVLFSFTFFWDGFTGLAITVGAILTLFAMMQVTGRLDWTKLAQPQTPPPAPPSAPISAGTPIARNLSNVVDALAMPPAQLEARS